MYRDLEVDKRRCTREAGASRLSSSLEAFMLFLSKGGSSCCTVLRIPLSLFTVLNDAHSFLVYRRMDRMVLLLMEMENYAELRFLDAHNCGGRL